MNFEKNGKLYKAVESRKDGHDPCLGCSLIVGTPECCAMPVCLGFVFKEIEQGCPFDEETTKGSHK